jgi:sarcosine oxidase subunit gamma
MAEMLDIEFGVVADAPRLTVELVDPACQILLTGVPDDDAFRATVEGALGFALPLEPNRVAGEPVRALSIAPGRWLIVSDDPSAATLPARLDQALAAGGGFASDLRDGMAVFEIAGEARHVLAMGCALDLDDASLAPGRCARTPFAGINTILYALGSRDRWRLHLDRAFARHMADWLTRAATAF